MRKFLYTVLLILFLLPALALTITPQEIMSRAESTMRGQTSYMVMSMDINNPQWSRTIKMEVWSEGTEKSLIHILAPPKEKGIKFLRIKNDLWNYLPKIERTIKIPPSMMLQSWMGSDFTNDDLVKESHLEEDYNQKLLRQEQFKGYDSYVLELTPKPNAPVVWGKIIAWVAKDIFVPLKQEYYDDNGKLVNVLNMSDIRKIEDRHFPFRWEMVPRDEEGSTLIRAEKVQFNIAISPGKFSLRELRN